MRHQWAKERINWKQEDWNSLLFSDETAIELNSEPRVTYVRRNKGEKATADHRKSHKPFKKRLLVWGAIHASGPGPIKIIRGTMDGAKYLETIQECVFPFAEEIGLFQQDNAPPHKTQVVLKSLEDAQITVMK